MPGGVDDLLPVGTELWVELKPEKRLAKRVVKHWRPVCDTVETEMVDEETGEIVDRKVESIDPESKMELRRHIVAESNIVAQAADNDDCNCYVTREELKDAFVTAMRVMKAEENNEWDAYEEEYEDECTHVAEQNVPTSQAPVSMQNVVADRLNSNQAVGIGTVVLMSLCAVLGGGILWVLFAM